ncbi:DUF4303 domain-containing protein [Caulobacter sp. LjRoot300]|uniref:DUF4303 domain-containing protein n=1 Tax=Caulobacter sp. LjRoot300 TaxID=3342321 RepID=UPI003ED15A9C
MSWKDISEELRSASLAAVKGLLSKHEREHIYALALFTSDDGANVALAANTEEGYQAHLTAEAEDEDEPNSPEDEIYYRWASGEWVVEGWDRSAFSRVNALLEQQEESDFDSYFDHLVEAMTTALVATKAALGERLADVTAFVTVTDSDAAEEIENASASRINAADLASRFLRRFG